MKREAAKKERIHGGSSSKNSCFVLLRIAVTRADGTSSSPHLGGRVHGARGEREQIARSLAVEHERREEGHVGLQEDRSGEETRGEGEGVQSARAGRGGGVGESSTKALENRLRAQQRRERGKVTPQGPWFVYAMGSRRECRARPC